MTAALAMPRRVAVSPYARRLARERGIALEALHGTGPGGRIVAADVEGYVPAAAPVPVSAGGAPQTATFAATIDLSSVRMLLAGAGSDAPFALDDLMLRSAGCALDDVEPGKSPVVTLELGNGSSRRQVAFSSLRREALGTVARRRHEAAASDTDDAGAEAALSLRLMAASGIRPVAMPLLPGRRMRLVVVFGGDAAECLLSFDAAAVDDELVLDLLHRFKDYLERPILLLA